MISFSPGPAVAMIAVLTESELPQVLKKAWSASTAWAISSSASCTMPPVDCRSSSPAVASTSDRNTSMPMTSATRGSTPRPCLWPGGVNGVCPLAW
nr:hypothetical protein [Herbidospora solisilvae]